MNRTTLLLPPDLKRRAEKAAARQGLSFGAFVREALERVLAGAQVADSLVSDSRVFPGDAPCDLSEEHDKHLYGE